MKPLRRLTKEALENLVDEATVDAVGDSERIAGFYTMMDNDVVLPFKTKILGVEVTVVAINLTADEQIVAKCTRGARRHTVSILDLPLPIPLPEGAQWIEAYRYWTAVVHSGIRHEG